MPDIDTTTTGNDLGSSSGSNSGDIGSGGSSQNDNGSTTINQGTATGTGYQYEIIAPFSGVGHAYMALNNSSIACNSSIAVFNRNGAFSSLSSSSASLSNCASYIAQYGFLSTATSRITLNMSVSSLAAYNYYARFSSSISASTSMSVFPLLYGTYASHTSSIGLNEFESMTSFWTTIGNIPTHFYSSKNSFVENSTVSFTSKTTNTSSPGLSGALLNPKNISFLWSQIWRNPNGSGIGNSPPPTSIFSDQSVTNASYRYVPFTHSLDYPNIVNNTGTVFTNAGDDTIRGLISLLAFGRNCYTSVKPPAFMFPPEDRSGTRLEGGLTGAYTMSNLLGSLV